MNFTSAAAGEIFLASNNKDLYVTNRLTGNATDSISHFIILTSTSGTAPTSPHDISLSFSDAVSSGGLTPRMASLGPSSVDNSFALVTNQMGDNGLLALKRDIGTGVLGAKPVATLANALFPAGGPEFAMTLDAFPIFPL